MVSLIEQNGEEITQLFKNYLKFITANEKVTAKQYAISSRMF